MKPGKRSGSARLRELKSPASSPAVLPGPEWMRITYPREKWTSAYTANVSIGQGYDLVSPLQLAMVYSTVANGGVSYYPRLVKNVVGTDGKIDPERQRGAGNFTAAASCTAICDLILRPEQIEMARRGLWKVVNEDGGTGGKARLIRGAGGGQNRNRAGHDRKARKIRSRGLPASRPTTIRNTPLW